MSKNKANITNMKLNKDYIKWFNELKSEIHSTQIKAAIAVNSILIDFYFALGKIILEKTVVWGGKLLETLSADLKKEFPNMQGFSVTNLHYCRQFYQFIEKHPQVGDGMENAKRPQLGDEIELVSNSSFYQAIR